MAQGDLSTIQFIAPGFNEDKTRQSDLAVRVDATGFYCVAGEKRTGRVSLIAAHQSGTDSTDDAVNALESWINDNPWLKSSFRQVQLVVVNQKVTLVPYTLYNPQEKEHYLSFNVDLEAEDQVLSDSVQSLKVECIFAIEGKMHYRLTRMFAQPEFHHVASVSLQHCPQVDTQGSGEGFCFCLHFSGNIFFIHLVKGSELIFHNSFTFSNPEEFIYYIYTIAEKVAVHVTETRFLLSGDITEQSSIYKELEGASKKLQFVVPPSKLQKDDWPSGIQFHLYHDLINLIFCES